jgi:hypothetical protein
MPEPFIQRKGDTQAYAVEPSNPNEHHLQTDDATLPLPSNIKEQAQYGLAMVKGKRVLVGALQFSISGCSPKLGALKGTCSGSGFIMAGDDSLLSSRGMLALKEGDKGQCFGIANSSCWPNPPVPIFCTMCIGKGKSLQPSLVNLEQSLLSKEATAEAGKNSDNRKNHFKIRLQFDDGSPAKEARWMAKGSGGTTDQGRLNPNGEWVVEMEDDSCKVTFPDFDQSIDTSPESKRTHAFELVRDLTNSGQSLGLSTAADLLQYWRSGGDDLEGANRPDHCWIDPFDRGKKGKQVPHSVFSKQHLSAVIDRLNVHREKYIVGASDRIHDGRVSHSNQVFDMKWENLSGNWLGWSLMDLQFGFGHCTIYSKVRVRLEDIQPRRLVFHSWEVALADRYDWEHGKSQWPGAMPLMNAMHFVRYWQAENPQEILHALEVPYGFESPDFDRVYARPFDIETEFFAINRDQAPQLFASFVVP